VLFEAVDRERVPEAKAVRCRTLAKAGKFGRVPQRFRVTRVSLWGLPLSATAKIVSAS